jgi:hypothetical protein
MTTFVVISNSASSPQRIEAESVHYDEGANMWVFADGVKKAVAWVPRERADVVARGDVVGNP